MIAKRRKLCVWLLQCFYRNVGDYLGGFRVIGGEGGYLGVGKSYSWICSFISNSGLGFM